MLHQKLRSIFPHLILGPFENDVLLLRLVPVPQHDRGKGVRLTRISIFEVERADTDLAVHHGVEVELGDPLTPLVLGADVQGQRERLGELVQFLSN